MGPRASRAMSLLMAFWGRKHIRTLDDDEVLEDAPPSGLLKTAFVASAFARKTASRSTGGRSTAGAPGKFGKFRRGSVDAMKQGMADVKGGKTLRMKLARAFLVLLLNIMVGMVAGLIFHELEMPNELVERRATAAVVERLNGSMPAQDWAELLSVLGADADALQRDIDAIHTERRPKATKKNKTLETAPTVNSSTCP